MGAEPYAALVLRFPEPIKQAVPRALRESQTGAFREVAFGGVGTMPNVAIRRDQRPRSARCFAPTCMPIASPPRSHVANIDEDPLISGSKAVDLLLLRLPMV